MLTPHGATIHLELPGWLLIFEAGAFTDASVSVGDDQVQVHLTCSHAALVQAQKRGKAYKRAMARQGREQQMAEAVTRKREERTR
jgi:hypothetical protein